MLVFDVILLVVLILMMIGLGLRVALPQLLQALREWPTLLLILGGEYLLMPLLTWLLILLLGATGPDAGAVAMVMLGPGTEAAAAAVFLARANLPLAIVGIVVTNIFSPLAAPILMEAIAPATEAAAALPATTSDADADLGNIALIFFLSIVVPLMVGMALRPFARGVADATAQPFRVFIWAALGLTVLYAVMLQASLAPNVELAPALPAVAGIVAATAIAVILVYAVGHAIGIRPENAVTAAFVVGLQPVAIGLYVAVHQTTAWPQLTDLSIGYALVLPFLIAVSILLAGRRLHLPRRAGR